MNISEMPKFWFLEEHPESAHEFYQFLEQDKTLGIQNIDELYETEHALSNARRVFTREITLPLEFPAPTLVMPDNDFAPDYFAFDIFHFCSSRLRQAMSQPESVVQYVPIVLLRGSKDSQAQDYKWIRVPAHQPAIDLQRSECHVEDRVNRFSGIPFRVARFIERCVLLENLQPESEIFYPDESSTRILVTESLALRVLQAGCSGVRFSDPGNARRPSDHQYRTATGIGTYRYGY